MRPSLITLTLLPLLTYAQVPNGGGSGTIAAAATTMAETGIGSAASESIAEATGSGTGTFDGGAAYTSAAVTSQDTGSDEKTGAAVRAAGNTELYLGGAGLAALLVAMIQL